jgi:hypothetical protein
MRGTKMLYSQDSKSDFMNSTQMTKILPINCFFTRMKTYTPMKHNTS